MNRLAGSAPTSLRPLAVVLPAVLAILLSSATARADLTISLSPASQTVTAGSSGSLEVDLIVSGSAVDLAGFTVQLDTNSSPLISFTGAADSGFSNGSYVFAGNSTYDTFFPLLQFYTFPDSPSTNTIAINDTAFSGSQSLAVGTYGLGVVQFSALAQGTVSVTLDPTVTVLSGPYNGSEFPSLSFTASSAMIDISPSAVPEPSSFLLAAISSLFGIGFASRSGRATA